MKIQVLSISKIPVQGYGGKERILWSLLKGLKKRGHNINLLAPAGSYCPFADEVAVFQKNIPVEKQIDPTADIIHFDYSISKVLTEKPFISRHGGNAKYGERLAQNTVFISSNQAKRHGGEYFIYNGLDPDDYGNPELNKPRKHIHFLAKAAWKVKNLKGALEISKGAGERLEVIGGNRINLKMGIRFYTDIHARFHGIIGGDKKLSLIKESKGLLFPVLWHEPFGNAMIESMYYGCPVIGTPFGSLPELINSEVGFLSTSKTELVNIIKNINSFNRKHIHEYFMENFTTDILTENFLKAYERILNGEKLNKNIPVMNHIDPPEYFKLTD